MPNLERLEKDLKLARDAYLAALHDETDLELRFKAARKRSDEKLLTLRHLNNKYREVTEQAVHTQRLSGRSD